MTDLNNKTVKELKQMVKQEGICGFSKFRKPELIRVLNELSNTNISPGDAKLIKEFEKICTLRGKKKCRITRADKTYLYHNYDI
jgi:hypothetical protein